MKNLYGAGTALVTPFKKNGEVDYASLEKLVEFQIANGTNYLVILGTTGETPTLNKEEKKQVIQIIKKTVQQRVPLVLGYGGNNTQVLIDEIKSEDFEGISALLSVSPYYNKPNQEGIYRHYQLLADHAPLPIIIYNVPGRTGSNISVKTTLKLAQHENIIGTKEASGNMEQIMQILVQKPKDFMVISGDDALTFPMMALGAVGVISVINNAYPKIFSKMVKCCLLGEWPQAKLLHEQLLEISLAIFSDGSPGGIKILLEELNIGSSVVRPPLWTVSEEIKKQLISLHHNIAASLADA